MQWKFHFLSKEIADIRDQIIKLFYPVQIYLFGSWAKGRARQNSDIDMCIIAETVDKRELARQILLEVEYERDRDVIVYTPGEWEKYCQDSTTFANKLWKNILVRGPDHCLWPGTFYRHNSFKNDNQGVSFEAFQ